MMGNIAPCARARIELLQTAIEITDQPLWTRPKGRASIVFLAEHDGEDVGNRALLDDDAAVHIGFAEPELRVDENAALDLTRRKANCSETTCSVAQRKNRSRGGGNPEIAGPDQPLQCHSKQPLHRLPPATSAHAAARDTIAAHRPRCEDTGGRGQSRPRGAYGSRNLDKSACRCNARGLQTVAGWDQWAH